MPKGSELTLRYAVIAAISRWLVALGHSEDNADAIGREFVRKVMQHTADDYDMSLEQLGELPK